MKKKILCFILSASLVISSTTVALAKPGNQGGQGKVTTTSQQTTTQKNARIKAKKVSFKLNGTPVIKYGSYKLPISPITKGMGATVEFDKATGVLTVTKGTNKIVIDFKNKTAAVNGTVDTKASIFSAKKNKKTTVLIKYIADKLGVRTTFDKDKVTVEVPGLDLPTNVTVSPAGTNVVANTLNSTTLYMTATANIKAGQATGGKAELYVGSKLVATDAEITATDTSVFFTTSDTTPTNEELKAIIPTGGVVTVKLYNAANNSVISTVANPTLVTDYAAPSVTAINSAVYSVSGSSIVVNVTGASAVGDKVDVTKISLYDAALGRSYQLTNAADTGSKGTVSSDSMLTITLGTADKLGLTGFGTSTVVLTVAAGSILTDEAGNVSSVTAASQVIPVTVIH
jgi:hypothetical protein